MPPHPGSPVAFVTGANQGLGLSLVRALARQLGGVDIVVSNAAMRRTRGASDAETIRAFIDTNNHGAHRMIRAFGPILNDDARFLVVASAFGRLRHLDPALRPRFWLATRPAGVTEPYGELVQHRVVLGYDVDQAIAG